MQATEKSLMWEIKNGNNSNKCITHIALGTYYSWYGFIQTAVLLNSHYLNGHLTRDSIDFASKLTCYGLGTNHQRRKTNKTPTNSI